MCRGKFKPSPVIVETIDTQWDGDLCDVRNIAKYNKNCKIHLVLQDVFSRHIFTASLKNKTASDVIKGLESIIMGGRKPQLLRTDRGSEFINRYMAEFLKKHGIHHIFTQNETESNFAERAIQNLQNRLSRMCMYNQSYSYLEELPKITQSIIDTPSRPLGNMAPSAVNKSNADEVGLNAYLVGTKANTKTKKKISKLETGKNKATTRRRGQSYVFKINDKVRITQEKHKFMREYSQKWTAKSLLYLIGLCETAYQFTSLNISLVRPYLTPFIRKNYRRCQIRKHGRWTKYLRNVKILVDKRNFLCLGTNGRLNLILGLRNLTFEKCLRG